MLRLNRTKLSPPPGGVHLIRRPRLEERLGEAGRAQLALVLAPAGFGKTTVMTQWWTLLQERNTATAWVTLTEEDNDVGCFLTNVIAVLQDALPAAGVGELLGEDSPADQTPGGLLLNLLNQLAVTDRPFALFLDEFEAIRSEEVLETVRRMLRGLPDTGILVLGSRERPDLGLGRLRARGLLVELLEKDLRFTPEEAQCYLLEEQGLGLDPEESMQLQRCTEGWAAGLQLAALACAGSEDPHHYIQSFSGRFTEIADYLAEDVFARQSTEVSDFLLKTSILNRFTGSLCDAITGRQDGVEMLAYLEKANLFLVRLDNERCWYSYHKLFAEFLRSRLERGFWDKVAELHRTAADWFLEHDDPLEAAEHAFAAGDAERAAGILVSFGVEVLRKTGQVGLAMRWMERLPLETLLGAPGLALTFCLGLASKHRHTEVEEILDRILHGGQVSQVPPSYWSEVSAIRAVSLMFQDRIREAARVVREVPASADQSGPIAQWALPAVEGFSSLVAGRIEEPTLSLLIEGRKRTVCAGYLRGVVYAACWEGLFQMTQGHLAAAVERYRWALGHARAEVHGYSAAAAIASVFLAETCYERNDLADAERRLAANLPLLADVGSIDVVLLGHIVLARIYELRGDGHRAKHLLDTVEQIGRERGLDRAVATVNLERTRLCLLRGDKAGAKAAAQLGELTGVWADFAGLCMPANDPETLAIGRLRLLIHQGVIAEAIKAAKAELAKAEAGGRIRQTLKIRCLLALALDASGERRAALRTLREALRVGSEEGFVRTFVDEGARLAVLIQQLCQVSGAGVAAGVAAPPLEYLQGLLQAMGQKDSGASVPLDGSPDADPDRPAESFTDREVSVLELLAQGLSNQAMADRLCVSESTVRYHLRNLNLKLGAKNRTQALLLARRFGVIP